jgi:hypothetical protein
MHLLFISVSFDQINDNIRITNAYFNDNLKNGNIYMEAPMSLFVLYRSICFFRIKLEMKEVE